METASRTASCSCGQLRVVCRGEPVRVSICHCLACQRRSGGPFGEQARFRREQITEITGAATRWDRVGDAGGRLSFHFCPTCGSTVYYTHDVEPDLVAIPVGGFADPAFPAPALSFYEGRKHGWVVIPDGPHVKHWD